MPLALVLATAWPLSAHALFNDDEARKAIIELRQRVEVNRQAAEAANAAHARSLEEARESNTTLRRSLLDLANQIEQLRAEMARLRGQNEQLAREVSELQRQQKDVQVGLDERLRKVEPVRVTVDGKEFMAEPAEQRDFEAAMQMLRRSEFAASAQAYTAFLRRYPESGYTASALYWLGNAQYANRAYKEAIETHRRLVTQFSAHPRTPEAMLALANSQVELKDSKAARRTLEDLIKTYPQSEAAVAARERLSQLR
ncbi:MAG: tol-pal system protein YbgF [Hydrogenophaga sp.]|nr:tol-pal system protein YbgF [Hydrogenophaga sp.]